MRGILIAAFLSACSAEEARLDPNPPRPPVARLALPRFGDPNAPLLFDASASLSPGGSITHYRFTPGDGTARIDSGAPRVRHAYAAEGVFAVSLEVEDVQGRSARADGQITVRTAAPTCRNDLDCTGLDTCQESRCTALWGPP